MPLPQREKLRSVYKTTTDSQNQMKEPPPQWLAERRKCPSNGRLGSSGPRPPGAVLSNDFSHIWCTGWIIRLDFGSRIWIGKKRPQSCKGPVGTRVPAENLMPGPPPSSAVLPLWGQRREVHSLLASCVLNRRPTADMTRVNQARPVQYSLRESWSWKSDTLAGFCWDLYPGRLAFRDKTQSGSPARESVWETRPSFQRETAQGGGPTREFHKTLTQDTDLLWPRGFR